MRILFCNIAWMDYYKGNLNGEDVPQNGGAYVVINGAANEEYNFCPCTLTEGSGYPEGEYCLGSVETKSTNGKTVNQLKIERISGCEALTNEDEAEDVLVVYCALYPDSVSKETYVVGWYKHATVYRYYYDMGFTEPDGSTVYQSYNAIAKKEDCVLLPRPSRRKTCWRVPRAGKGVSYGFGQSNVWYAEGADENPSLKNFTDRLIGQIEEYHGDNWIDRYPDDNEE